MVTSLIALFLLNVGFTGNGDAGITRSSGLSNSSALALSSNDSGVVGVMTCRSFQISVEVPYLNDVITAVNEEISNLLEHT